MPGLVRKGTEDEDDEKDLTPVRYNGRDVTEKNYEDYTVRDIMIIAASTDEKGRRKLRKLEEKTKKRSQVIEILRVNWNS